MPHSTYLPGKMGTAVVEPVGQFEAGSFQEFTVTYTAGYFGIAEHPAAAEPFAFGCACGAHAFDWSGNPR